MKKFTKAMAIFSAMTVLAVGTTAFAEEKTTEAETAKGVYTLYNTTGENVKEIYLYEANAEKGENQCPDGLRENDKLVLTYEGAADATLVLEFVTEGDTDSKFETLHVEEAPISLLAADAVSGATPISFTVPEGTGVYTFINTTGEDVTELYVYPAPAAVVEAEAEKETETEAIEKGENLAKDGLADGESVEFKYTGAVDTELIVEFTTAKDGAKFFNTLHIEEAKINLLAAEAMTGATPIEFTF